MKPFESILQESNHLVKWLLEILDSNTPLYLVCCLQEQSFW